MAEFLLKMQCILFPIQLLTENIWFYTFRIALAGLFNCAQFPSPNAKLFEICIAQPSSKKEVDVKVRFVA